MISLEDFTPTEQRILCKLLDQCRHTRQELVDCINDNEGETIFSSHMFNLRKKLRIRGYTVALITIDRKTYYELARVVATNTSE